MDWVHLIKKSVLYVPCTEFSLSYQPGSKLGKLLFVWLVFCIVYSQGLVLLVFPSLMLCLQYQSSEDACEETGSGFAMLMQLILITRAQMPLLWEPPVWYLDRLEIPVTETWEFVEVMQPISCLWFRSPDYQGGCWLPKCFLQDTAIFDGGMHCLSHVFFINILLWSTLDEWFVLAPRILNCIKVHLPVCFCAGFTGLFLTCKSIKMCGISVWEIFSFSCITQ